MLEGPEALKRFYDACYEPEERPEDSDRYAAWRRLSAVAKADHVAGLVAEAGLPAPESVVDVGCGDGALMAALAPRWPGARIVGYELSESAVALAAARPEIARVAAFDGARVPEADAAFDLSVLSHVLEHVPDPGALLAEAGRVARHVVVEVPLEANVSARRPGKRRHAEEIGHLHAFDRGSVARMARAGGFVVLGEVLDPLGRDVHRFFAGDRPARLRADLKWLARRGLAAVPALGTRAITLHHAVLLRSPAAA